MGKHKFNHDEDNLEKAVGLSKDELAKRLDTCTNDDDNASKNIERISKEFSKVELSFLLHLSLIMNAETEEKLERTVMLSLLKTKINES